MVLAECGMNCKGRVTNWCTMYTQNFSKTFTKKMCASTRKKTNAIIVYQRTSFIRYQFIARVMFRKRAKGLMK